MDLEKKRPAINCSINGVSIESRYNDLREVEVMLRVVMVLPPDLQANILSIYCDSKATSSFTVTAQSGDLQRLARHVEGAIIAANGGHNGIEVQHCQEGSGIPSVSLDPDWDEW